MHYLNLTNISNQWWQNGQAIQGISRLEVRDGNLLRLIVVDMLLCIFGHLQQVVHIESYKYHVSKN